MTGRFHIKSSVFSVRIRLFCIPFKAIRYGIQRESIYETATPAFNFKIPVSKLIHVCSHVSDGITASVQVAIILKHHVYVVEDYAVIQAESHSFQEADVHHARFIEHFRERLHTQDKSIHRILHRY